MCDIGMNVSNKEEDYNKVGYQIDDKSDSNHKEEEVGVECTIREDSDDGYSKMDDISTMKYTSPNTTVTNPSSNNPNDDTPNT